jgi:hypothetical protein
VREIKEHEREKKEGEVRKEKQRGCRNMESGFPCEFFASTQRNNLFFLGE